MNESSRKIQIGVIGSTEDLAYEPSLVRSAEAVGSAIARKNAVLLFGAEKDFDSLSAAACRGAKKAGGLTVGVTYGKDRRVINRQYADVIIASGLERGGGRESALVLSCDAVIALGGGSGTLTEIAIAYQANIPVVVLQGSGGWSEKLAGRYLDARRRMKIRAASSVTAAVNTALDLVEQRRQRATNILVLTNVHGNETIGSDVMSALVRKYPDVASSWLIANPEARSQNRRFLDADMNRIAPGSSRRIGYEYRWVRQVLAAAQPFDVVLDVHGTPATTGIFTIVTNPTRDNLCLAARLPIRTVVIWPSTSSTTGPVTKFVTRGVEIECGPQDSPAIRRQLACMLESVLRKGIRPSVGGKKWFLVYGKMKNTSSVVTNGMREFSKVAIMGERFYPLLINRYSGIACYKMRAVPQPKM